MAEPIHVSQSKLEMIIPVHASAVVWFGVIAQLQLALRHPRNVGPSTEMVREFAKQLIEKLADEGVFDRNQSARIFRDLA